MRGVEREGWGLGGGVGGRKGAGWGGGVGAVCAQTLCVFFEASNQGIIIYKR